MKSIVYLALFILGTYSTYAQDIPPRQKTPNYELRNNDFVDKRETPGAINFAKTYYESHKASASYYTKHKKAAEWIPKGPFGKDELAGMGRVNSVQFHPTDTNTWYICVAQGGVWKTTNAGQSWTSISSNLPILRTSYLAVHPINPDIMYIAIGDFAYLGHNLQANENKRNSHYGLGVYKTLNGGASWFPTGLSFEQSDFEGSLIAKILINPSNPDSIIAVGQTGCYLSDDAGTTFTKTKEGLFWDLESHPTEPNTLFASTGYVHSYQLGNVSVLKSTDFGVTWSASNIAMPSSGVVQRVELAVSPSDPNYIYAIACDTIGGFYGFYKSTNGGASFTKTLGNNYAYNILNHSMGAEPGGQGRYDLAISVDRYNKNKVLIGGINIWQTADGGNSFKPITYWLLNYYQQSLHADVHEIVQHPSNSTYFACHDGGISRTFNVLPDDVDNMKNDYVALTEWTNYTDGLNITSFYRLSINALNTNEMMAGAQDNSTVFTDGTDFYNVSGGDGMESVFADDAFFRYTSSQNGRILAYNSVGGGFNYENMINPPSGEFGEWTTPFVFANNKLYIGYSNIHTASFGYLDTRLTNSNSNPITALDVQSKDAKRIYYAKRGYTSLNVQNATQTSADGGNSWTDISAGLPRYMYPGYIEMNQAKPAEVWICFPGFDSLQKVFHSVNGGSSWTNVTYDLPNIPVNCIAHQTDGSNILYAGTDLGVYALYPDSTHWIFYSEGLPNVIVSELEINEVDRTLVAATFGRGLWEVNLLKGPNVGIADLSNEVSLHISPNPVSNKLTITTAEKPLENAELLIIDITGKEVMRQSHKSMPLTTELDLSHLITGQYFIVLQTANGRITKQFIKE
jgi:photosystem II stability/assembly factor-like uncharacterized protein